MKRILLICILCSAKMFLNAQDVGVKTNLLYDATATFNLGVEIGLGAKTSLDISGNYNPWDFSHNKRWKHWLAQPEFRYWFCEKFNGHFLGIHAHAGEFNLNKLDFSDNMKEHNYQGEFYGGGISYGYQWILSNRWGLEASIGAGYAHIKYDKYPCTECGTIEKSDTRNYWGPTKVAVSLIYFIF